MKIICDNCRTKYSIADEKVKGKVFKIRCKKCSNIIVVRGNQPQEAESQEDYAGDQEADYKDAPVWHLVINQQQVGPMTSAEVRDRFAQGEIDTDSYIWKEGFSDWLRMTQVDEFSDMAQTTTVAPANIAAGAGGEAEQFPAEGGAQPGFGGAEQPQWDAAAGGAGGEAWSADAGGGGGPAWEAPSSEAAAGWSAPEGDTSRTDSEGLFGGQADQDPGQDLFASNPSHEPDGAPSAGGGNLFAGPAPAEGGDLFGSSAAAGGGNGGPQLFGSEEEPQPAEQMTATRNENSVLFSLTNLQSLAMGGKGGPAVAPGGGGGGGGGGTGDGSGLIDIRSMAGGSPRPAPAAATGEESLPDLGGFSAPIAAAPVLIPAAGEERPKWLLPVIIGGVAVVVLAVTAVVLVIVLKKEPPPVVVAQGPTTPATETKLGGATEPAKAEEKKAEEKKAEEAKADEKPEVKGKSTSKSRRSSRRSGRRSSRSRTSSRSSGSTKSSGSGDILAAGGSSSRRPGRKRDALDELIDGAVGSKSRRKKSARSSRSSAPAAADSNLPETLGRSQIQAGMRGIKGKVQGCYDRYKVPGLANVQVKIARNGRVKSARVKGMFAGTPTGACVQSAARSAKFARFKGAPITITYPFILR